MCIRLLVYFLFFVAKVSQFVKITYVLVKFMKHNQNFRDLYQRPSSEEAGTQFFWFLTQREDAVSRKRSYAWLSW